MLPLTGPLVNHMFERANLIDDNRPAFGLGFHHMHARTGHPADIERPGSIQTTGEFSGKGQTVRTLHSAHDIRMSQMPPGAGPV
jgi:hypothetical protein